MEVSRSTVNLESRSAAILLQDVLSKNQISTIHSTIEYFSKFLEENKKLDEKEAKLMWFDDIQTINSSQSSKVLEKLQNIVQKNYFENFALEKAIINKSKLQEDNMFTKFSRALKDSPKTLKERISTAVKWIIEINPKNFQKLVWKEAFEWQRAQMIDMQHFVKTFELYRKEKKAESGGLLASFSTTFGFVVGLFTPSHDTQPSRTTFGGHEYTNFDLQQKNKKNRNCE